MAAVALGTLAGFVFDLDGCVWNGNVLNPGAGETLAALDRAGRRLAFVSNNSRATGGDLGRRLHALGVAAQHVLTPLEIIGEVITERWSRSRVLVMGAREMGDAIARAGHAIVDFKDWRNATVVAVGNDFDLTYERLTVAARAAAATGRVITPNVDPQLPVESGEFMPGCGAIVAAVAVAAGDVLPVIVGKPQPPLFRMALERLGLPPASVAMVGDSLAADIRGARGIGMPTVLYAPQGSTAAEPDLVVRSFAELARLAGVALAENSR